MYLLLQLLPNYYFRQDKSLINHWKFDNTLTDSITGLNPINSAGYIYTTDRHGITLSAVYLNNGYLQVQNGVYFSGDFTFSAWISPLTKEQYQVLIDFGNGPDSENIQFTMGK